MLENRNHRREIAGFVNQTKVHDTFSNTRKEHINNKANQALVLPTICNLNPRSVYNKINELITFITEEEVDLLFVSESWEREEYPLPDLIKPRLMTHEVISNVWQRKGRGGRPAVIVNKEKYNFENVTNRFIQVPWGVEATWCIITPKNVTNNSIIQKIACCAVYSKPNSKKKSLLLDHLSDAYNMLNSKHP